MSLQQTNVKWLRKIFPNENEDAGKNFSEEKKKKTPTKANNIKCIDVAKCV